jgi:hypothetical protein
MHLPRGAKDEGKRLAGDSFSPVRFSINALKDEAEAGLLMRVFREPDVRRISGFREDKLGHCLCIIRPPERQR